MNSISSLIHEDIKDLIPVNRRVSFSYDLLIRILSNTYTMRNIELLNMLANIGYVHFHSTTISEFSDISTNPRIGKPRIKYYSCDENFNISYRKYYYIIPFLYDVMNDESDIYFNIFYEKNKAKQFYFLEKSHIELLTNMFYFSFDHFIRSRRATLFVRLILGMFVNFKNNVRKTDLLLELFNRSKNKFKGEIKNNNYNSDHRFIVYDFDKYEQGLTVINNSDIHDFFKVLKSKFKWEELDRNNQTDFYDAIAYIGNRQVVNLLFFNFLLCELKEILDDAVQYIDQDMVLECIFCNLVDIETNKEDSVDSFSNLLNKHIYFKGISI